MKPLRSSWPETSLLGGFAYRDSASTNIAETIARERKRIERERRDREHAEERAYDEARELLDRGRG